MKQSREQFKDRFAFRIYDTKTKSYVDVTKLQPEDLVFFHPRDNTFGFDNLDHPHLIYEPSTGYRDLKSKLIFEHDRVLFRGTEAVIVWTYERGLRVRVVTKDQKAEIDFCSIDPEQDLEVIGTIHKKYKKKEED